MTTERLYQFDPKETLDTDDIIFCGNTSDASKEVQTTVAGLVGAYPNLLELGVLSLTASKFLLTDGSSNLIVSDTVPAHTLAGEVDADSNAIINLPAPTNNGDAANKLYVDSAIGGVVDSVAGTTNEIDVDNTDPANPIVSLPSVLIAPGTVQSGNVKIDTNTITSTDTDGNLNLTPNGAGDLILDAVKWPQADGETNQVLATNGSGQGSWVDQTGDGGSGGLQSIQVFTSTGTWTKPAGINSIIVEVVGGGGAGGSIAAATSGQSASSGGGGGGGYSFQTIDVGAVSDVAVTIGAAGAAAAAGNNVGGNGGDTVFTGYCTGGGGVGGAGSASSAGTAIAGGAGGVGSGGDINITGGDGGNGQTIASGIVVVANNGGTSKMSGSQSAHASPITAAAGQLYGGGGAGIYGGFGNAATAGSAGAAGICIVYEYIVGTTTDAITATQTEMEAASSSAVFSAPAVQQFHPGHPKGWVQYNHVSNTVLASYNVTSVTDNGTGDFSVNWGVDFSSANYSVAATSSATGGGIALVSIGVYTTGGVPQILAGSVQMVVKANTTSTDYEYNSVAAFGDQA